MATPAPSAHDILIATIDEAFQGRAWHGPTLSGALRGVTAAQAEWRPAPERHNIWELTVHAAYWKYAVRQRLARGRRGAFPSKGSNWFERPSRESGRRAASAWEDDLRLLKETHRQLREAIVAVPAPELGARVHKLDTAAFLIRGIAAHDLYHAGQIQLLKRLQR